MCFLMEVMKMHPHILTVSPYLHKGSVGFWSEITLFRSVKWEFNSSDSAGQQGIGTNV